MSKLNESIIIQISNPFQTCYVFDNNYHTRKRR